MKLAVVAANGRTANKVIDEAVNRGFDVTAFGRGENNTNAQTYNCQYSGNNFNNRLMKNHILTSVLPLLSKLLQNRFNSVEREIPLDSQACN